MQIITTMHPYSPFIKDIASHPNISGIRLNTVMRRLSGETQEEMLTRVRKELGKKDLWVDLKCRQVRTSYGFFFKAPEVPRTYVIDGKTVVFDPSNPRTHGVLVSPPWSVITIDHKIKLDLSKGPVRAWFNNGFSTALIVAIEDGNTLFMLDGPQRVVGGGESVNITDPSFEVEGEFFTEQDSLYIEAAKKVGIHKYMLSFVEEDSDIEEMLKRDPEAEIIAKIESLKGIRWVKKHYYKYRARVRLMAARGDMYTEVGRPDKIIRPLKLIASSDPTAIAASRIFGSLLSNPRPTCADVMDVAGLIEMGYSQFMIGDDICFNRDMLLLALDIMKAIGEEYEKESAAGVRARA